MMVVNPPSCFGEPGVIHHSPDWFDWTMSGATRTLARATPIGGYNGDVVLALIAGLVSTTPPEAL